MPVFDWICRKCGHKVERECCTHELPTFHIPCVNCGTPLERVMPEPPKEDQ
ncbi:MAG: hypothetical protein WC700_17135 [Gemmatimonadaceae bacterium]|jgi:hypothetical protein